MIFIRLLWLALAILCTWAAIGVALYFESQMTPMVWLTLVVFIVSAIRFGYEAAKGLLTDRRVRVKTLVEVTKATKSRRPSTPMWACVSDQGTAMTETGLTEKEYNDPVARKATEAIALQAHDCSRIQWADVSDNEAFWQDNDNAE